MTSSSAEDWTLDDDEEAFLDSEEPADAIALARTTLKKRMKEFYAKRDAFLALAATVNDGCQRYFVRADLDRGKGKLEKDLSYWKARRGRAITDIEKAHAKKEAHLKQITDLTKELATSRSQVQSQLAAELQERNQLLLEAKLRREKIKAKLATVTWISTMFLILLLFAFLFSF